jgi:hypothetical protein
MDGTDSSSDSSSDESTPARAEPSSNENQAPTLLGTASALENDDSASDVSMSADTDDEEDESPNTSAIQVNRDLHILEELIHTPPAGAASDKFNKRKFSSSTEDVPGGMSQDARKRLKPDEALLICRTSEGDLPPDKSLLPAEIWHHIFTFVPPRNLGLLLSVNRSFNTFLDPSLSGSSIASLSKSAVRIMKPDAIWRASRRLFLPGMPAPLTGKSELEMWKLVCSSSCQFCGKRKQPNSTVPVDQWHPGPGETSVVPVWSFGIHSCGPCIQQRSMKVVLDFIIISLVSYPPLTLR